MGRNKFMDTRMSSQCPRRKIKDIIANNINTFVSVTLLFAFNMKEMLGLPFFNLDLLSQQEQ